MSAVSAQISPSAPEGVFPNTREPADVTTVNVDESKVRSRQAEELGFQVVKDRYLPRRPHGATVGHSSRGIFVRSSHRRRSHQSTGTEEATLGYVFFPVLTLAEPGIRRFYLLTSSVDYVCVVSRTYLLRALPSRGWWFVLTCFVRCLLSPVYTTEKTCSSRRVAV